MPLTRFERRIPKQIRPTWRVVRRTLANYLDEEGLQWSGAVAFYLVLSVPPLLIAAVSIGVVVVGADAAQSFLVGQVQQFLPARPRSDEANSHPIARRRLSGECAAALGVNVGDAIRFAPLRPSMAKAPPATRSVA